MPVAKTKTKTNGRITMSEAVTITAPNFRTLSVTIEGTAPYVQHKFSAKARQMMKDTQEAGSTSRKGKKKEPKDFEACCEDAKHKATEGWCGIPASGLRAAMVRACSLCGFHMTKGKLCVFVEADGYDSDDGTPLVRITKGEPHYAEHLVRLPNGSADIRARPMWDAGWQSSVRIRYDADQFTSSDVANLLQRVGMQVGIGEGRPDSKGTGMGWGIFQIINEGADE